MGLEIGQVIAALGSAVFFPFIAAIIDVALSQRGANNGSNQRVGNLQASVACDCRALDY